MKKNILHYKEQTREIELHLEQETEIKYLRVNSCENPFCNCEAMDLYLFKKEDEKHEKNWNKYEISVKEKILEVSDNFKMSNKLKKETIEIKKELENKLTEFDWELLKAIHKSDKEEQVERIENDDEYLDDFEFGYIHMNEPSLLIGFHEIYPLGKRFKIETEEKTYELFEYYCKNSKCECTKVEFEFELVGDKKVIFTYDYDKKKIDNNEYEWVIEKLREDYEEIEKRMELRSARIKLLYNKKILQRLQEKIEYMKSVPTISEKTGRNEKCPCGSGKKYKKCCMQKAFTNN